MSVSELNVTLLAATGLLLLAIAAVRLSTRAGLPTLLIYLGFGPLIGESGLGLEFEDVDLTQVIGLVLLGIIVAEGGFTTRWEAIKPIAGMAVVLATFGVAISMAVTAGLTYLLLDVDLRTACLLGAVVSSTDAAAVFSVLRRLPVPLRPRVAAAVEAESGLNDPLAIILVTIVVSQWGRTDPFSAVGLVVYQLVGGALIGLLVAIAGQQVLRRSALPAVGLYPVATIAICLFAFATAGVASASSFAAVYVAGLWLGNAPLPHRKSTAGFAEGLAWLSQIGLFVLLGLLASPSRLPDALLPALVVGSVLLLLSRPLSVALCLLPFRVPWQEQAFMSWAGLRGAVPIVLAAIPMSAGLPGAEQVFDIVFLLVVVFTLIQAPPMPWLAQRLGVAESGRTAEVGIESAPLEEMGADLVQVTVPQDSQLHGVAIFELRLPKGAQVSLIVRDGRTRVPDRTTVLREGDHLLLVVPNNLRDETERRLRAVGRAGRLARWYGETGDAEGPDDTGTGPSRHDAGQNGSGSPAARVRAVRRMLTARSALRAPRRPAG